MDKAKQVLHYKAGSLDPDVREGFPCYLEPIDHPSDRVSNTQIVVTSPVVHLTSTPKGWEIETMNTIYIPKE